MAIIRSYANPTVEARPMPGVAPPNRAAPVEAFGNALPAAAQARDLMQAGQQTQQASDNLFAIEQNIAKEMNDARVQDLGNQFVQGQQKILFTAPDAFYRQKGDAAIKAAEPTTNALMELKKQFVEQAGNSYQRQALEKRLDLQIGDATGGISRHVATQAAVWQDAVAKGTVANAQNEAALNYNDPAKVAVHAEGAYQTEYDRVFKETGSPEAAKASATAAQSKTYRDVISLQVSGGDSAGAIATFEAYKDKFSAGDRTAVVEAIKTMQIGITARSQAQTFVVAAGAPPDPKDAPGVVKHFEGFIAKAKVDTDGKYRVGYGSDTVTRADGKPEKVTADTVVTKEDAERDLARRLPLFQDDLKKKIGTAAWDALTPEAQASLSSIVYNYGSLPDSLVKPVQSGDPAQIAQAIRGLSGHNGGINASRRAREAVNVADAAPTDPSQPKNGPAYKDTRVMLLDAERIYDAATLRNQQENANNDGQRRATQAQLDLGLASQKRQIEMAKNELEIAVDKWMTAGGGVGPDGKPRPATQRPPPEIWNQLHYEKQKSIDATILHNVKGTDAVTDQQAWYEIQKGLTSEDPKVRHEWANKPLWEYKNKLSNSDFQELAKMQGTIRQGDPDKQTTHVRNINQMVDDTLNKIKIDPTPKPGSADAENAYKFRRWVQDQITALEATQPGKKATTEQQQKIIDRAAIDVVTKKGMLWDDTKRGYDVTIKDVPDAEKAKITDALKRQGYTPTDDMIVELFARKNAKQAK